MEVYHRVIKKAKPNKLKVKTKKVDYERRIMIKFKDQDGNEAENAFDLPATTTLDELREVLKSAVQVDEDTDYSFYYGTHELRKRLAEVFIEDPTVTGEENIVINYLPQSTFKVRPVTRISSSLEGHKDSILDVAFSPNGRDLVSASGDHTLRFWDIQTETPISICEGHKAWVLVVSWSPDGLTLASGDNNGQIRTWDPRCKKKSSLVFNGHKSFVSAISWEPLHINKDCTRFVSGSKDKTVRVWNSKQGNCLKVFTMHTACVTSVIWSGEGTIYSSSEDRTVKCYNLGESGVLDLKGHGHWVNCMTINTAHVLRTGCYDEKLIQLQDREKMQAKAKKRFINQTRSKPELLVTGSDDCTLYLWKPKVTHKAVKRFLGHQKPINHVQFSPNGQLIVSASYDKSLRLWNLNGDKIAVFRGHIAPVYLVCWSSDSRMFVSGSKDSTMKVWDVKHMKLMFDLPGHADEVYALDWSPDGMKVASGSKDRVLRIWQNQFELFNCYNLFKKSASTAKESPNFIASIYTLHILPFRKLHFSISIYCFPTPLPVHYYLQLLLLNSPKNSLDFSKKYLNLAARKRGIFFS